MGFNPVKRVGHKVQPVRFRQQLGEWARQLADRSPLVETPYLTVSLDWRPEGSGPEYRAAIQRFEQEAGELRKAHWPRGQVYDSLGQDIESIRTYLDELDPSAKGVFIVSNSGAGVFEATPLGLPVPTTVKAMVIPALLPLVRLDEDNPPYAVLVADQTRATVRIIAQAHQVEHLVLRSSDYPRKQASGGWSQRRFQQRADERLMALARRISEETERFLEQRGVDALIVAGDDVLTGALDRVMSQQLKNQMLATIRLDNQASDAEVIESTASIAAEAEAARERAAVENVKQLSTSAGRAVVGSTAVLNALKGGQARELIINDDFHEDGWADFTRDRYGVGVDRDVLSDDELDANPIDIEEEMTRLAIATGAEIDVIHSSVPVLGDAWSATPEAGKIPRTEASAELEQLGGVAAILRYTSSN